MRIGYFADGPWSHRALEALTADGRFDVAFIVARHPSPDLVLCGFADRLKVPFLVDANVNAPSFIEKVRAFKVDLNISLSFNQILKKDIINVAPLGFINCHASLLPFYRGCNVLNWALINNEKQFGVTVMYVDEGIDTGDIILQKESPIGKDDDYGTLLVRAYELCATALYEALVLMHEGRHRRVAQSSIHPIGFYCGRRVVGDEFIDWNWPTQRIHNFVRAITKPGPCARTRFDTGEMAIIKTRTIDNAPDYISTVGEVVGRGEAGIVVKTGDNTLMVTRVATVDNDGNLVDERTPRFKIGTRLAQKPRGYSKG